MVNPGSGNVPSSTRGTKRERGRDWGGEAERESGVRESESETGKEKGVKCVCVCGRQVAGEGGEGKVRHGKTRGVEWMVVGGGWWCF